MMTREQSNEIWDLVKEMEVAMLVTQSGRALRARPMYQVQEKFDGTIWFITSEASAKTDELNENQQVCLAYADPAAGTFVSLSGSAGLNKDRALINKFWHPRAEAWFDGGQQDPDVTLLEIFIEQAEVWDAKQNRMLLLYELAKSKFTGDEPHLGLAGENRKYG